MSRAGNPVVPRLQGERVRPFRESVLKCAAEPAIRRSAGYSLAEGIGSFARRWSSVSSCWDSFRSRLGQPGLVAAYAFDEAAGTTPSDASGSGNTGTINGATWTSGRYSYGLAFNGSSARVNVQDAPSLDLTSAMRLKAWNPTTVTAHDAT
jgi:hypothetical protein